MQANVLRSNVFVRLAGLAAGATFALSAAAVHTGTEQSIVVSGGALQWGAAPPVLPGGAQITVLYGDPGKDGPYVIRLKFPSGYVVPPHSHSKDELVTVISGKMAVVAGEKIEKAKFKTLAPGSFVNIPAGTSHYAMTQSESVVQINGDGPFDIKYVNSRDDPRGQ